MPKPFRRMSSEEFADALGRFPFRDPNAVIGVHMHHTFHPNRAEWKGLDSVEAMWRFHTQIRGFSDIAQHITIDPEGFIWTGRRWDQPPASATGFNGNSSRYPFMFEMIGDFDEGRELFDGRQKQSAIEVIARVQHLFELPPESLRFHNQMSRKTCPGSAVRYEEIVELVKNRRKEMEAEGTGRRAVLPGEGPFPSPAIDTGWSIPAGRELERADGETCGVEMSEQEIRALALSEPAVLPAPGLAGVRGGDRALSPADLSKLRPHVINLTQGRFSSDGAYATAKEDVDAIFGEHLPAWLEKHGGQVKLMLYAHGGLVSEKSGLGIAGKHVDWWKRNGVYPIYFVWETGLMETLGALIGGAQKRRALARDVWDHTTDRALELVARPGGLVLWSGMKRAAELAMR
ncbi:MAG: peptidoglycan recognition protein family protein, partial [Bryobacteraceae bacterium]